MSELLARPLVRQMNSEARGWMDSIPDWVGNRCIAAQVHHQSLGVSCYV